MKSSGYESALTPDFNDKIKLKWLSWAKPLV